MKLIAETSCELLNSQPSLANVNDYAGYCENRVIFAAPCIEYNESGLVLKLDDTTLVIPTKLISEDFAKGSARSIEATHCVGKNIQFMFVQTPDGIAPSRADVQKLAREEINKAPLGTIYDAAVYSNVKFGTFVDIGPGIRALIPSQILAVSHTYEGDKRFAINSTIRVVLHSHEKDRLTVATTPLLGTFDECVKALGAADTVIGKVKALQDYGAFVELAYNLVGLTVDPLHNYKQGDTIIVRIKNVYPNSTKIRVVPVGPTQVDKTTHGIIWGEASKLDHIDRWVYNKADPNNKCIFDYTKGV